jgi:hypothetical protein
VALSSVLVALAVTLASAPGAAAAPVTLTWSGLGGQWSEKANWEGDEAPGEAAEPVDLAFPLSACQQAPFGCPATTDDLAGLTVGTVTLESRDVAFTPKEPPEPGEPVHLDPGPASYFVKGDEPLTLMEGVVVHNTEEGTGQGLAGSGGTTLDLPLVLAAANSWSVGPAPGGLDLWGTVTGDYPLAVTLGKGDPLEFASDVDVGPITITGPPDVFFGGPEANRDLNGTDGEPVELKGGSLWGGGRVGPLTIEGGGVEPGFPGNGGKLEVNGALSLDSASNFTIEAGPQKTPEEVTATGSAQLGSARLAVFEGCVEPGSAFTLVRAQGGVSGEFTGPEGAPIENGQLLEGLSPSGCGPGGSEAAPPLRIEYGPETVTATAVAGEEPQGIAPEGAAPSMGASGGAQQGIAAYTSSSPALTVTGPVKVRSRKILVPLRCSSSEGACTSVGLRLSVVEHLLDGRVTGLSAVRRSHRSRRVVVLAREHVTLAAGQSRTVEVPLGSATASIAAGRTVHALLSVTYAGRTVRSETVAIPALARRGR